MAIPRPSLRNTVAGKNNFDPIHSSIFEVNFMDASWGKSLSYNETINDKLVALTAKIGEKISFPFFVILLVHSSMCGAGSRRTSRPMQSQPSRLASVGSRL